MNKLITSFVLAAAFAAPASASDAYHPDADSVIIPLSSNPVATTGQSREGVVYNLGEPTEKLSANLWIYSDFKVAGKKPANRADTLIVVFKDDRVSVLRLTDGAQVRAAITKLRAAKSPSVAVASK